jgi:hypothetical protein
MKMKTTLLYRVKQAINRIFGISPKKDIIVRMDLLNHTVTGDRRDELKKLFNVTDVTDNIVDGKIEQTIKEEFNSLPFSRLSDEAMLEIIRIARLDISNHVNNLGEYTSSVKNVLDELSREMETNIK